MSLALFCCIVFCVFLILGMPAFELGMAALLLTPVFGYILAKVYGLGPSLYYLIFIAICIFFLAGKSRQEWRIYKWQEIKENVWPCLAFLLCLLVFHQLCLSWPDFIAMGERLRDYAILSSTFKSPLQPLEPWMSGSSLNYYVYWYRFGYMLGQLFGLEVWQVYHLLMAFVFAFYTAIAFRLFRTYLKFSLWGASVAALLVSMGSNVSGIIFFLVKDTNWWGPSRVIPGAINEFPAWSFLLGDLHPHYLNLALVPFFILLCLASFNKRFNNDTTLSQQRSLIILSLLILPPLWIFSSNAWEIPMWFGLIALYLGLLLCIYWGPLVQTKLKVLREFLWPAGSRLNAYSIIGLIVFLVAAIALRLSAAHIVPIESATELTWVMPPIAKSFTWDFYLHWGFPLTLVSISVVILQGNLPLRMISAGILLGALAFPEVNVYLYALLVLNFIRVFQTVVVPARNAKFDSPTELLVECLGLAALGLLLLPEVVFLNDDYGGENERMNTIFKIYSFNWFIMHSFAFYLCAKSIKLNFFSTIKHEAIIGIQAVMLVLLLAFFYRTAGIRKSQEAIVFPAEEGLSQVEREFPGSSAIIKQLRSMPEAVVLEAQGNPYSYTTFVTTLAGKTAFLGWANHVNLLTHNYDEVGRREKLSEQIYTGSDCAEKLKLLSQEGISYVVLGVLEQQQYAEKRADKKMNPESFSCLKLLASDKEYKLFTY